VIYFPIENAHRAEDLIDLRIVIDWENGEEFASLPRIEYRKIYNDNGDLLNYQYVPGCKSPKFRQR
jgi:hypothetical protein